MDLNAPVLQTCIVGATVNAAGAAIAAYLWNQLRSERYLLFWAGAWTIGTLRWMIHLPADSLPALRAFEAGVLIPVILLLSILGAYALLPSRPWAARTVAIAAAAAALAYGALANLMRAPIEMSYALFALVLLVPAACLWIAYRATAISGYAFAAVTFACQSVYVGSALGALGTDVANNVVAPLFNVPLALSLVVIAYQRHQRQLVESERTLQKLVDTAPTPILITRPPNGEVERANALAREVLGFEPGPVSGMADVDQRVTADLKVRCERLYTELGRGARVVGREILIDRAGEPRTLMVNADRLELEDGPRYVFSFYDFTDLRRAEAELRASTLEMQKLYLRLGTVEEDERRALHRELHDRVGANLSALRLELDVATTLLARDDAEGVRRHLQNAQQVTKDTISMSRDLMAELRPPALDEFGLVAALRSLAESQARRLELSIEVSGNELSPRPAPFVETVLFRIAQEALMNSVKHASAERIGISLSDGGDTLRLSVEDDGEGFDVHVPTGPRRWGLQNMDERARSIGGMLRVESVPGTGTRVTVELARVPA
jgi:signal transduction histidine kinase